MGYSTLKPLGVIGLLLVILGSLACASAAPKPTQTEVASSTITPKYGGMLLSSLTSDPPSFDAQQEATTETVFTSSPAYDRLLQFDDQDDAKLVPDLAARWEWSPDGKSLTFFLQKGVKFHNGSPFTADDVKFSMDRLRTPPKGVLSPRQGLFEPVTDVVVVDDSTVKVTVKRPYPAMLSFVAGGYMPIYDREFVEQRGQDIPKKEVMGTGQFKLKEYIRGVSFELAKNEDYWVKGRPYLDGIKYYIIPDPGTTIAAFRSGQLLMGEKINANQVERIAQEMGEKVRLTDPVVGFGPQFLSVNVNRPPFDNMKVRQAISYALNRTAAAKLLNYQIGGVFAPPWSLSQEELAKFPGYGNDAAGDIAKAKQLLSEAGYPNGLATTMITRNDVSSWQDMAVFAKDYLTKVGITAELSAIASAPFYDIANTRNFNILAAGVGLSFGDPDAFYAELWACDSLRNYAGYCDPEMEALFLKQSSTLDAGQRAQLVFDLERKALQSNSKFIVGYGRGRQLTWKTVQGYYPHRSTYNNKKMLNVWLEK